jgi:hypothetical protein
MARRPVTLRAWLDDHTIGAPAALRERVIAHVGGRDGPPEEVLAAAGLEALRASLAAPGDRSVALDLLAADALVTLSLQAGAERDPAGLDALARRLQRSGVAVL